MDDGKNDTDSFIDKGWVDLEFDRETKLAMIYNAEGSTGNFNILDAKTMGLAAISAGVIGAIPYSPFLMSISYLSWPFYLLAAYGGFMRPCNKFVQKQENISDISLI